MKRVRRRCLNAGFTMIEMMVAMAILVILVGALYTCFVSVADTAEIARSATEEMRIQRFLREHLGTHLRAVHANASGEYALIGEDESGPYGPADSLTFTTTLPTSGAKSLPGIVKKVAYQFEESDFSDEGGFQVFSIDAAMEEKPSETLLVTERPLELGAEGIGGGDDLFEEDEEGLWERELAIRSLNFEYYDGVKEDWVEEWNSDELGFLPWAIRVGVNMAKTEGQLRGDLSEGVGTEEDPDLSLVVVLPTGVGVISETEFIDPNHFRPNTALDDGTSIFEEAG